ncbi:MAG TPA: GNAT family N-acetyltransferase [Actinomycetota bacterium]|nr:GNAT family N-acetyltransferase [Actinomycetota bacterium]
MDVSRATLAAFERDQLRRTTLRALPFAWGMAYLDDRFPLRWDSNLLWADASLKGVRAADVAAECDRVLGGEGLAHRNLLVEDEDSAQRIAPGLAGMGYEWDRLVTMVHHREPARAPTALVDEVDVDTYIPIVREALRPEPYATSQAVIDQLTEHRRVLADIGARFFVAYVEGEAAGRCELYITEGIAQVEDVGTVPAFRNRGLGSAVVMRAVAEARAAGAEVVFLNADADDWPMELYARLGFDELARWSGFVRAATV